MDWIAGILTLYSVWLVSRHKWQGWAVGLLSQPFFAIINIQHGLWGLMPMWACMLFLQTRALTQWRREEKEQESE